MVAKAQRIMTKIYHEHGLHLNMIPSLMYTFTTLPANVAATKHTKRRPPNGTTRRKLNKEKRAKESGKEKNKQLLQSFD